MWKVLTPLTVRMLKSVCLFLLSYPQTDFTILTANGPKTFHIGLNVCGCLPR